MRVQPSALHWAWRQRRYASQQLHIPLACLCLVVASYSEGALQHGLHLRLGSAQSSVTSWCSALQATAQGVTNEELERAKRAAIASVYMNLESRAVVAEDIGRQILTYGHRCATHKPHEILQQT